MSPISTRICVPNLVAVRRSCRKKKGGYRKTDKRTLQLYIIDRTLVPVIWSPPYSGIRSVIPSQVAESPRYNSQSWPRSGSWLQIQLPATAGLTAAPDEHKRDDNKRKPTLVGVIQRSFHIGYDEVTKGTVLCNILSSNKQIHE